MQSNKVDMYMLANSKFFRSETLPYIQERLASMPEERLNELYSIQMKDPMTMLLVSIFIGEFGVDRFMIGDTLLGVLKLITLGGCLIWWIIDIFLISNRVRDVNYNKLMQVLDSMRSYGRLQ
ncbi:MAG: TM2 domain-containing protein [Defluviitaleaceae bacterium]|nr:TM2 domain-containing protein [Defluviitaleaceae bacterium]